MLGNEKEEINALNGNFILYAVVGRKKKKKKHAQNMKHPLIQDKENIDQILTT